MSSGSKVILVGCAALCAGALTLAAPSAMANVAASVPHWRVVAQTVGWQDAVVAPTPTSAWTFGWGAHPPDGPIYPIGRHWNGHRWSRVQFPIGVKDSGMSCAGASSPSDAWAFSGAGASGGNPPSTVSALRLRAGSWVIVKNFHGSYVTGCNVLSATNVWVFGGSLSGLGPGIGTWHLRGSIWTQINTGNLRLFTASVVSATDIWAAGASLSQNSLPQPAVARWNGTSWHQIPLGTVLPRSTSTTGVGLGGINAISGRNVFVQAAVSRTSGVSVVVVHWNGHSWNRVKPGSPDYYLPTAAPDGHGSWWSVPYLPGKPVSYLLHRSSGRWTRFSLPAPLMYFGPGSLGITHVPDTNAMLAAGTQNQSQTTAGLVLAFGKLPA